MQTDHSRQSAGVLEKRAVTSRTNGLTYIPINIEARLKRRLQMSDPCSKTTADDEFMYGIWWVSDGNGGWRDARLSECAAEIKRLRAELATTRRPASPAS